MSDASNERPADLRAIYQLLQSGAYEQAADMLHNVQSTGEANGGLSSLVAIVALREICLACLQCQAEVEWHRQAGQATERREQQLKNHAQTMLDWVSTQALVDSAARGPMTEPHPAEAPEGIRQSRLSLNARNLMQRVKHLLEAEHTTTATPLPQEKERPALSDSEPGEPLHLRVKKDEGRAEPTSQVVTAETETPAASAPRGELAEITPLSTLVAEEELEPALPAVSGAPETPIVSAPPAELAAITPFSTAVAEEELEPPLPVVIGEPETSIVSAPPSEFVLITPLSTAVAEEELEPPLPAVIGEPETSIVSAPPSEFVLITPLSTAVAEEELEPALPAAIGEPETPAAPPPYAEPAPPAELAAITLLSAAVAEEELEPPLPAGIEELETPICLHPPVNSRQSRRSAQQWQKRS